jgi:hypothetical protein
MGCSAFSRSELETLVGTLSVEIEAKKDSDAQKDEVKKAEDDLKDVLAELEKRDSLRG